MDRTELLKHDNELISFEAESKGTVGILVYHVLADCFAIVYPKREASGIVASAVMTIGDDEIARIRARGEHPKLILDPVKG